MTRKRITLPALATLACAFAVASSVLLGVKPASAQAVPTATGPGSFISAGLEVSGFQQDYGQRYIGGEGVFVDANLYRRVGIEAEVRLLNARTSEDVKLQTYLIGPRISTDIHSFRPYIKLLAGRGGFDFPFHYATGSYFVVAPGAGLDWHLGESRFNVRVIDFEYQVWPQFSFGELHPYGASVGISYNLFEPGFSPRGRRFR
jgi:hypothetical protein